MDSTGRSPSTRDIRSLTIAVWALVVAVLFNTGVTFLSSIVPSAATDRAGDRRLDAPSGGQDPFVNQYQGFHEWPLEKQIQAASVIVVTIYEEENGKLKSIISEILKQQPGVSFDYEIGDEYADASIDIEGDTRYGDGQVIFLVGSPPEMRLFSTYTNRRNS